MVKDRQKIIQAIEAQLAVADEIGSDFITLTKGKGKSIIQMLGDQEQIVRCKDCKHYMTIHCTCDGCCISPDWFCADGVKKDG